MNLGHTKHMLVTKFSYRAPYSKGIPFCYLIVPVGDGKGLLKLTSGSGILILRGGSGSLDLAGEG
jgi:hypothetical protein